MCSSCCMLPTWQASIQTRGKKAQIDAQLLDFSRQAPDHHHNVCKLKQIVRIRSIVIMIIDQATSLKVMQPSHTVLSLCLLSWGENPSENRYVPSLFPRSQYSMLGSLLVDFSLGLDLSSAGIMKWSRVIHWHCAGAGLFCRRSCPWWPRRGC